jgi:hypothetical protein
MKKAGANDGDGRDLSRHRRTLTVCEARAYATHDGVETLIATMSGTLMALATREGAAKDSAHAPA